MKPFVRHLLAALLLAGAMPACAQTAAPAPAAADPARLAAAQAVVGKLMPAGIYKRLMGATFDQLMDTMTDSMGAMPADELVRLTGISKADAEALGDATIGEVMDIYDPHWSQRLKLGTRAMGDAMSGVMSEMEPVLRDALARAYAREFSAAELAEMSRFFATPAGNHYADQSLALAMDPEMVKAMTGLMPKMIDHMPDMVAKAEAATKELPKPRTNKDLTPAERKKLAGLLGLDAKTLERDPAPAGEPEQEGTQ
ncbi:DUF2059 domain-containing protein [Sphingomonas sp. MMS12-HWE2-04]|uniref:DUF2059 domain-containing protein n=1 Tax=Sphingomonas sp. MMS12-HWE2-04 TaxID=3234199 RepID=UPI003850138A